MAKGHFWVAGKSFIAIGLNPIINVLMARSLFSGTCRCHRHVGLRTHHRRLCRGGCPISHEFHALVANYPRYKSDLVAGRDWAGKLVVRLHLTGYLDDNTKLKLPVAGGLLGAGRVILSVGVAMVSVVALTIYFLIAYPV
jgi:hypothetical protein